MLCMNVRDIYKFPTVHMIKTHLLQDNLFTGKIPKCALEFI